jgi:hypothetical protein
MLATSLSPWLGIQDSTLIVEVLSSHSPWGLGIVLARSKQATLRNEHPVKIFLQSGTLGDEEYPFANLVEL